MYHLSVSPLKEISFPPLAKCYIKSLYEKIETSEILSDKKLKTRKKTKTHLWDIASASRPGEDFLLYLKMSDFFFLIKPQY